MLTRFVRIQLVVFLVASVLGVSGMALIYIQAPRLLGVGHTIVKLELPASGGLYRFSNVTMRGVQIGRVTGLDLQPDKVVATLSLDRGAEVPADVQANVRSISAVGEQYVDLVPRSAGGPLLRDNSVIPQADVTVPQQIGPVLDQVSALLATVPTDRLGNLIDETYEGLSGAGYDLGSLMDSGAVLSRDFAADRETARALVDHSVPLLDSQVHSADAIRTWAANLAGVTEQLAANDPDLRTLLGVGPGFMREVSALLAQVKPTLPVLLANLASVGQVGVTYRPGIEQLLVMLPLTASGIQSFAVATNNPTGIPLSDFGISIADPPVCTVGFLPPSSWRSPADETDIDTPDGLYCKLPQDSPVSVRGARNSPCMEHPGKRAPTVQICNSDQPYRPLATRQHALGPYPFDPNLIAQGVPPDSRVTENDRIFGPIEGTPPPPSAAAPPSESAPPVAVVPYNPNTGQYVGPDGAIGSQTDLVAPATDWEHLMPQ